jgi:hypothetical protein
MTESRPENTNNLNHVTQQQDLFEKSFDSVMAFPVPTSNLNMTDFISQQVDSSANSPVSGADTDD